MLTKNALELTRLIGDKELDETCLFQVGQEIKVLTSDQYIWLTENGPVEIIGHPCQLHDLFRYGEERKMSFDIINFGSRCGFTSLIPTTENFNIPYNPTLPLYSQSDETLAQIINLIKDVPKMS